MLRSGRRGGRLAFSAGCPLIGRRVVWKKVAASSLHDKQTTGLKSRAREDVNASPPHRPLRNMRK